MKRFFVYGDIFTYNTNRYTEFPSKGAKIVNGTLSLISFISAKAI